MALTQQQVLTQFKGMPELYSAYQTLQTAKTSGDKTQITAALGAMEDAFATVFSVPNSATGEDIFTQIWSDYRSTANSTYDRDTYIAKIEPLTEDKDISQRTDWQWAGMLPQYYGEQLLAQNRGKIYWGDAGYIPLVKDSPLYNLQLIHTASGALSTFSDSELAEALVKEGLFKGSLGEAQDYVQDLVKNPTEFNNVLNQYMAKLGYDSPEKLQDFLATPIEDRVTPGSEQYGYDNHIQSTTLYTPDGQAHTVRVDSDAYNNYLDQGATTTPKPIAAPTNYQEALSSLSGLSQSLSGLSGGSEAPEALTQQFQGIQSAVGQMAPPSVATSTSPGVSGSIVDYLNARGIDSSFSSRANLWQQYGGGGEFTGSADQNLYLLGAVQKGEQQSGVQATSQNLSNILSLGAGGGTAGGYTSGQLSQAQSALDQLLASGVSPDTETGMDLNQFMSAVGATGQQTAGGYTAEQLANAQSYLQSLIDSGVSPGTETGMDLSQFINAIGQTGAGTATQPYPTTGTFTPGTSYQDALSSLTGQTGTPSSMVTSLGETAMGKYDTALDSDKIYEDVRKRLEESPEYKLAQSGAERQKAMIQLDAENALQGFMQNMAEAGMTFSGARGKGVSDIEAKKFASLTGINESLALTLVKGIQSGVQDLVKEAQDMNSDQRQQAIKALDALGYVVDPMTGAVAMKPTELRAQQDQAIQIAKLSEPNIEITSIGGRRVAIDKDTMSVVKDFGPSTSGESGSGDGGYANIDAYAQLVAQGKLGLASVPSAIRAQVGLNVIEANSAPFTVSQISQGIQNALASGQTLDQIKATIQAEPRITNKTSAIQIATQALGGNVGSTTINGYTGFYSKV